MITGWKMQTGDTIAAPPDSLRPIPRAQPAHVNSTKRMSRKAALTDALDEPLIDTTVVLPLHSKKLERRRKRKEEKAHHSNSQSGNNLLLDLPAELLLQVLGLLRPTDVLRLQEIDRYLQEIIRENERPIAKDIIRSRYWVLSQSFILPVALKEVDPSAYPALLNEKRQKMLAIHKKPYQHVPVIDQQKLCTCITCLLAWNNLCMAIDLAHWQKNLNEREPIPMIPRGGTPEWNRLLLERNAMLVERAMQRPLTYAIILQKHLASITGTILRRSRWTNKPANVKNRVYHLSEEEAATETDEFLERSGPPSYEFPFHRDNYYSLEAYVPNRRWSADEQRWMYYSSIQTQHDKDVAWTKAYFSSQLEIATNSDRSSLKNGV